MIGGTRAHAEALREEVAAVLRLVGPRLSEMKTRIAHIDEGFDFHGFRIKRHLKRSTGQHPIYTHPSKAALTAVRGAVWTLTQGTTNWPLKNLLHQLNLVLRGWTTYFRHGVSKPTFNYLRAFVWRRVVNWLRHMHRQRNWAWLRRRHLPGWSPTDGEVTLFNPGGVPVTR
jgi:RNA-directed DNA polymerase